MQKRRNASALAMESRLFCIKPLVTQWNYVAIFLHQWLVDSKGYDETLGISCRIFLRWMPQDLFKDDSTLVQVMAWCYQITRHYLNHWWLSSILSLQWRHNGHDSISNHQPHDCLLNHLFRRRSKKISKFRITGLCVGNSPGTSEYSAQMTSNAENVSIWWRHHGHIVSPGASELTKIYLFFLTHWPLGDAAAILNYHKISNTRRTNPKT